MTASVENRRLIERLYEAADAGNLAAVAACFSVDLVDHHANQARQGDGSHFDTMMWAFEQFLQGFPDTRHVLHDIICEDDRVVVRVSAEGTHSGPAFGFPPSGEKFRNDSIAIYRCEEGKIVEKWSRERRGVLEAMKERPTLPSSDRREESRPPFRFYSTADLPLLEDVMGARFFEVSLERSMLTYFELAPESYFPEHRHVAEQITLVLSGHLLFTIGAEEIAVGPMEAIALASNVPHSARSLDSVVAVDSWSPPPQRYRRRSYRWTGPLQSLYPRPR